VFTLFTAYRIHRNTYRYYISIVYVKQIELNVTYFVLRYDTIGEFNVLFIIYLQLTDLHEFILKTKLW